MSNKITDYFSARSGKKFTNMDLLNAIREHGTDQYKNDIPEFPRLQAIEHANIPYGNFQIHQNQFFDVLINRIGATVYKALSFENPLGVFKTENFEHGETLQEIYVGLTSAKKYDGKSSVSPFRYAETDVKVFYHDLNDERLYERTVEKQWAIKAFVSDRGFDEFINKMLTSLMSSDTLDEFEAVKRKITESLTPITVTLPDGTNEIIATPSEEYDLTEDDFIIRFNKELITRSNLFTLPSNDRFENGARVPNSTPLDEQFLLVTAEFSSELDTMLANAFNMDKASVLAKKIVIDVFPPYQGSGVLNGVVPFAALVSKHTIILKDKLLELNNIFNPRTLSYNYFLHHHQLISYSLLENAKIYYTRKTKTNAFSIDEILTDDKIKSFKSGDVSILPELLKDFTLEEIGDYLKANQIPELDQEEKEVIEEQVNEIVAEVEKVIDGEKDTNVEKATESEQVKTESKKPKK